MFGYSFSIVHVFVDVLFIVCSPNVAALVLGFFDATSVHNVPKYYCGNIYMCIHLVWGYNSVWGYCIANQNQCMTTKPCFGLLFKNHLSMVSVTCQNNLNNKQPLVFLMQRLTKNSNLYLGLLLSK